MPNRGARATAIHVVVVPESSEFGRADDSVQANPVVPVLRLIAGNVPDPDIDQAAVADRCIRVVVLTQVEFTGERILPRLRQRIGSREVETRKLFAPPDLVLVGIRDDCPGYQLSRQAETLLGRVVDVEACAGSMAG